MSETGAQMWLLAYYSFCLHNREQH